MQVTYNGADSGNALNEITPGCGFCSPPFNAASFGGVESARTTAGADVVAFMMDGADFSGNGIAWLGSATPSANFMYSVTQGCVRGCESVFIHEVGHNMGNNHDRATVQWQAGGVANPSPSPSTAFSFGLAFCKSNALNCNPTVPPGSGGCSTNPECSSNDGSNFRDLMAYFFSTTSGSRQLYRFSNPNQNDCRAPGGGPGSPAADLVLRACGIAGQADTAQVMNTNRAAISAVKASTIGSTLQFTATSTSAGEGTSASLSVARTGSSTGAVSVAYSAVSGTAQSGSDFTATSGTLNWANGDTANKTITVPITNDGLTEDSEVFTVTLSNPLPAGGANGAVLGPNTTATVLIPSPYPPGGTLPAGFVTPDGSSGAWSVVTDQAFEGPNSLGSFKVLAATQGVFVNSDLRITGTFIAGT
ncbi:MAG: Calx-beta domain-containing protein, partial [Pseudomonadota bacterium]